MTPKQKLFAKYYISENFNGTKAYQKAYKCKNPDTARANASKLLANADIKGVIDSEIKNTLDQLGVNELYVISNLKTISERCMQAEPVMFFNRETKEWETTGEYKFDSNGAIRSIELLGKWLNLFEGKELSKAIEELKTIILEVARGGIKK